MGLGVGPKAEAERPRNQKAKKQKAKEGKTGDRGLRQGVFVFFTLSRTRFAILILVSGEKTPHPQCAHIHTRVTVSLRFRLNV